MPITVENQPSFVSVGQTAYQTGLANFMQRQREREQAIALQQQEMEQRRQMQRDAMAFQRMAGLERMAIGDIYDRRRMGEGALLDDWRAGRDAERRMGMEREAAIFVGRKAAALAEAKKEEDFFAGMKALADRALTTKPMFVNPAVVAKHNAVIDSEIMSLNGRIKSGELDERSGRLMIEAQNLMRGELLPFPEPPPEPAEKILEKTPPIMVDDGVGGKMELRVGIDPKTGQPRYTEDSIEIAGMQSENRRKGQEAKQKEQERADAAAKEAKAAEEKSAKDEEKDRTARFKEIKKELSEARKPSSSADVLRVYRQEQAEAKKAEALLQEQAENPKLAEIATTYDEGIAKIQNIIEAHERNLRLSDKKLAEGGGTREGEQKKLDDARAMIQTWDKWKEKKDAEARSQHAMQKALAPPAPEAGSPAPATAPASGAAPPSPTSPAAATPAPEAQPAAAPQELSPTLQMMSPRWVSEWSGRYKQAPAESLAKERERLTTDKELLETNPDEATARLELLDREIESRKGGQPATAQSAQQAAPVSPMQALDSAKPEDIQATKDALATDPNVPDETKQAIGEMLDEKLGSQQRAPENEGAADRAMREFDESRAKQEKIVAKQKEDHARLKAFNDGYNADNSLAGTASEKLAKLYSDLPEMLIHEEDKKSLQRIISGTLLVRGEAHLIDVNAGAKQPRPLRKQPGLGEPSGFGPIKQSPEEAAKSKASMEKQANDNAARPVAMDVAAKTGVPDDEAAIVAAQAEKLSGLQKSADNLHGRLAKGGGRAPRAAAFPWTKDRAIATQKALRDASFTIDWKAKDAAEQYAALPQGAVYINKQGRTTQKLEIEALIDRLINDGVVPPSAKEHGLGPFMQLVRDSLPRVGMNQHAGMLKPGMLFWDVQDKEVRIVPIYEQ